MDKKMKQDFAEYLTEAFITFMDVNKSVECLERYYLRNKSKLDVIKMTDKNLHVKIIQAFKDKKAEILEKQNDT